MNNKSLPDQKSEWKLKLEAMDDAELRKACNQYIWLSAYANNNPRSAYHWMAEMTYDECKQRNKLNIYSEEYNQLVAEAR